MSANKKWIHQKRYHKGDYEIIYVLKGPLYLQLDDQEVTVNKNSVLIVPPYTQLVGSKPTENNVDFYWLHFFPQCSVTDYEGDLNDFSEVYSDTENCVTLPMSFNVTNNNYTTILFHQVISTHKSSCPVSKCDFLVSALLIDLFDDFSSSFKKTGEHSRLQSIREYITANMSRDLTVESVAENVHLNRNYLTRLFKKYLGVTANQYIINLKIEVASLLLLRTDMPINVVAAKSFFSNPKVFMRRFKAVKGLSPSKYRQKYQNINKNNSKISPFVPIPATIANLINDGANENINNE